MSQNTALTSAASPAKRRATKPRPATKKSRTNKRQLILDKAAQLFKERGFGSSSMRDLAERAGMEAASMYNHITGKDEILEIICFQVANIYVSQLDDIERLEASYADKIKALIRLHIQLMIENGPAVSVANNDWKSLTEPKLTEFKQARKRYEKGFAALIEGGIAAGELQPVNVSVALFTILSAVRWVELWYRPGRELSAAELEANIITMLLNGLEKNKP